MTALPWSQRHPGWALAIAAFLIFSAFHSCTDTGTPSVPTPSASDRLTCENDRDLALARGQGASYDIDDCYKALYVLRHSK